MVEELLSSRKKSSILTRQSKATIVRITLFIIAIVALLPLSSIIDSAYAKIVPSNRPDIKVDVGMVYEEILQEGDSSIDIEWDYVTEETFEGLSGDLGNLGTAFDLAVVPAVEDFLERHKSELEGNYVDTLYVRYRPHSNEIFLSIWYSIPGLYETLNARPIPQQYALTIADEVSFKISILQTFPKLDNERDYQSWIDFNILDYNILPRASARVAYLGDIMQELYLRNRETLLKNDTTLSLPDKEPIIVQSISAVMFQEMSKLDIYYMDRPVGLYGGRIMEYDTGAARLASIASSARGDMTLRPNEEIIYVKHVNQAINITASVHMIDGSGDVQNATLEYPDGKKVAIQPMTYVDSYDEEATMLTYVLDKGDPPGLYRFLIQVPEEKEARAWIVHHTFRLDVESGNNDNNNDGVDVSQQEENKIMALPNPEQLQECQELGIDEENCTDEEILSKATIGRKGTAVEKEEAERQQTSSTNMILMIGIGAAIAGIIGFVTLRKL